MTSTGPLQPDDRISTGLSGLDEVLDHLRIGDNVVWRVSDLNDYRRFVLPFMQQVVAGISPGVPVISFATGNPQLLPLLAEAEPQIVGVDWRIELAAAWDMVGDRFAVQGNLEPAVLLARQTEIKQRTKAVLQQAAGRRGHIFNLGHGVLPQTPPENARALVEMVHDMSAR